MSWSEPWGAIAVPMEAHSKQRDQSPRTHESGELKYRQNGQKVAYPLPLIEGNCNLLAIIILAYCSPARTYM